MAMMSIFISSKEVWDVSTSRCLSSKSNFFSLDEQQVTSIKKGHKVVQVVNPRYYVTASIFIGGTEYDDESAIEEEESNIFAAPSVDEDFVDDVSALSVQESTDTSNESSNGSKSIWGGIFGR